MGKPAKEISMNTAKGPKSIQNTLISFHGLCVCENPRYFPAGKRNGMMVKQCLSVKATRVGDEKWTRSTSFRIWGNSADEALDNLHIGKHFHVIAKPRLYTAHVFDGDGTMIMKNNDRALTVQKVCFSVTSIAYC